MKRHPRHTDSGLEYAPGLTGKYLFRVRESYIDEHVGALVEQKAAGAAKVDLVLRGLALLPEHAKSRRHGLVLPSTTYTQIHDLCRDPYRYSVKRPEADELDDTKIVKAKRGWVGDQIAKLEERGLLERNARDGRRPEIVMLKDDGSGDPFDDPGLAAAKIAPNSSYITILGSVLSDSRFRSWGSAELVGYFCAMTAERRDDDYDTNPGSNEWYRTIEWFRGRYRPEARTVYPFSERTIRAGLQSLDKQGFLTRRRTNVHQGHRFDHPRTIYQNAFAAPAAQIVSLTDAIAERSQRAG